MTDCGAEPLLRGLRGGPGMRGRAAPRAAALGWCLGVMPPSSTEWRFRVRFGVCFFFLIFFYLWLCCLFFFGIFVCFFYSFLDW